MGITGITPPVIGAVFGFFDDFTAIQAKQSTAVATLVESKRDFAVSVASPTMCAMLGRCIRSFAIGIGAVPSIAVAHRIPFGRMMCFADGTRPIMIATRFLCQNFPAFVTEGIAAIAGNRFFDDIYFITVRAMPACGAVPARGENRIAIRTPPVFLVAYTLRRMLLVAIGAIPDIGTGLPDIQNGLVFGAVPAVGVAADKIRRVMGVVRIAIPKMRTVFRSFENFVAENTQSPAAVTAFFFVELILTFGTIPTVLAMLVRSIIPFAFRTIPMLRRTRSRNGMVRFTGTARPEMRAGVIFPQNLFTGRTVTIPFRTNFVQTVRFFAVGTKPAVFAGFIVPIGFFTDDTVPTLIRTFFVDAVSFATLNAKPGVARTGFVFRMRFGANGTKPCRFRIFQG